MLSDPIKFIRKYLSSRLSRILHTCPIANYYYSLYKQPRALLYHDDNSTTTTTATTTTGTGTHNDTNSAPATADTTNFYSAST